MIKNRILWLLGVVTCFFALQSRGASEVVISPSKKETIKFSDKIKNKDLIIPLISSSMTKEENEQKDQILQEAIKKQKITFKNKQELELYKQEKHKKAMSKKAFDWMKKEYGEYFIYDKNDINNVLSLQKYQPKDSSGRYENVTTVLNKAVKGERVYDNQRYKAMRLLREDLNDENNLYNLCGDICKIISNYWSGNKDKNVTE